MKRFQHQVANWMYACFGTEITADKKERNHRFLEEALELVQSRGCTKEEAQMLVEYVFARPVGQEEQELGGVMLTLAALANTSELELLQSGQKELIRCWNKIDKIRQKQATKPQGPLPQ